MQIIIYSHLIYFFIISHSYNMLLFVFFFPIYIDVLYLLYYLSVCYSLGFEFHCKLSMYMNI